MVAHYQYDDQGERRVKQVISSAPINPTAAINDTLYVNPWFTVQTTKVPAPVTPVAVPPVTNPVAAVNGLPTDESRSQYVWAGITRLSAKLQLQTQDPGTACPSATALPGGGTVTPPVSTTMVPETVLYYHSDHLGGMQYIDDQCQAEIEHAEYLPYGQTFIDDTNVGTTTDPATLPTTFNPATDLKFTDKNYDPESGFYYFGARYFDPKAQVWLSPDPILSSYMRGKPNRGVYSPMNLGLYTYGSADPIRYLDPDGRTWAEFARGLSGDYHSVVEPPPTISERAGSGVRSFGKALYEVSPIGAADAAVTAAESGDAGSYALAIGSLVLPELRGASPALRADARAASDLERGGDDLYHYTNELGAKKIEESGLIKADDRGRVFLTSERLSPEQVNNTLFVGRSAEKGSHVVVVTPKPGFNVRPGKNGLEKIHQGSIRQGRQATFTVKKNDFPSK